MFETIKEKYEELDQRERWMVLVASALVAATLVYLIVIEPYIDHRQMVQREVSEKQELLAWMQGAKNEIQALEGAGRQTTAGSGQSLFAVVDQTSEDAELGRAVRQITPDGDDAVRVRMEGARFDYTLNWLQTLEQEHGIEVSRVSFDHTDQPGRVNVSLSLERNGS